MADHGYNVWVLKTDGSAIKVDDAPFTHYEDTGWELSLKWAKEQIGNGCTIAELVRLPAGDLWVDEEGLFREERILNPFATVLYRSFIAPEGAVVGNAVLVMKKDTKMDHRLSRLLVQMVRN
jgi:hypothetical protein